MKTSLILFSLVLVLGGALWWAFEGDMSRARTRLDGRSALFEGTVGAIEYAVAGEGPPLIMIHGTGGGFDQGLLFAAPLIAKGWKIVALSRFGYLRTTITEDDSPERQADAIAELMDELGIERAPVIGGSAGALSALAFAIRHPERTGALIALVPASHVPGRPPPMPNAVGEAIMRFGLESDFLYWAGLRVAKNAMIATLLASDPALLDAASASEQARIDSILETMLPISARGAGIRIDAARSADPPEMALAKIAAPTLAISVEDDRFGTAAAARHIAAEVPGARLILYPSGGHVWVGHDEALFAAVDAFLREAR